MPQETDKNQDQSLRKPPSAGGPRRVGPEGQRPRPQKAQQERVDARPRPRKKSRFKKALPYLIPGLATGGGFVAGLTDLSLF